jgi:hypothetical protein
LDQRVAKLRDLVARLEQLPASDERDRILRDVRSRTVDVDTGATPQAMRPAPAAVEPAAVRPPPDRLREPALPSPRRPRTEIPALAELSRSVDLLESAVQLSLADPPDEQPHGAWRHGLRG